MCLDRTVKLHDTLFGFSPYYACRRKSLLSAEIHGCLQFTRSQEKPKALKMLQELRDIVPQMSPLILLAVVSIPLRRGIGADDVPAEAARIVEAEIRPYSAISQSTGRSRMKTLGGKQFWGDVHFFRGHKIQQNHFTGHFRLLDPRSNRITWGTKEHCEERLEKLKADQELPEMTGKAVVLVHGIGRSSGAFYAMNKQLAKSGYTVVGFEYPSTQAKIEVAADYLRQVIDSLDGVEQIDFVTHSMGGLVVRSYLADLAKREEAEKTPVAEREKRLHRLVMLGTPNNGAYLATMLKNVPAFRAIFGPAGQQLAVDINGLIGKLPTPEFEFAIIAGGRRDGKGFNPLIPGDDDGTVSVESTKLPGATDFAIVPAIHAMLLFDKRVVEATEHFLTTGSLRESGVTLPIPKNVAEHVTAE